MRLRGTVVLAAVALALGVYVWLVEIRGAESKQEAESAARTILAIAPASVTSLSLDTSDAGAAVLVRAGENDWKLEAPVAYPADADAVDRVLRALEKLESTATIAEKPADLAPFGLASDGSAKSRKTVELRAGETPPQTLFLGGNTPVGGDRYVELASDPTRLYTVSAGSLSDLTPTLLELRDKRLLRMPASAADELTVRAGGELVVRATKADSGWMLVEPESAPADPEKIRRVLDDLALGRASAFEDAPKPLEKYGLAKPEIELTMRAKDAEERLALARADGRTWLSRAGDPVILEVNERALANVPRAFFDYRAKRVLTLDVAQVRTLELAFPREGKTQRLKRDGETWTSEEAGVELQSQKVEDLVYALSAVDATGLEAVSLERAQIGLDPALAIVRAFDEKGALLGEVRFGDPHPERGLPALSSQSPLVWRVTNDIGRDVPLSPEAFTNLLAKPAAPATPAPEAPASSPPRE